MYGTAIATNEAIYHTAEHDLKAHDEYRKPEVPVVQCVIKDEGTEQHYQTRFYNAYTAARDGVGIR